MVYDFGVDDATLLRALAAAGAHGGMLQVHCENRTILESLTARHLAAGAGGAAVPRELTPAVRRGRGDGARDRAARKPWARRLYVVHLSSARRWRAVRRARDAGRPVFAETCPHYLTPDGRPLRRPARGSRALRHLAAAAGRRPSRGAVGRPGRRIACARGHRPRPGPARGREAVVARVVRPDLERGTGHRDAAGDRSTTRALRTAGSPSSAWSTCCPRPRRGCSGCAARVRSRSGGTPTSCCSIPPRGGRSGHADLHHSSDYTPYEGREIRGAVRSTIVRGSFVVRDGALRGEPRSRPVRGARARADALGSRSCRIRPTDASRGSHIPGLAARAAGGVRPPRRGPASGPSVRRGGDRPRGSGTPRTRRRGPGGRAARPPRRRARQRPRGRRPRRRPARRPGSTGIDPP